MPLSRSKGFVGRGSNMPAYCLRLAQSLSPDGPDIFDFPWDQKSIRKAIPRGITFVWDQKSDPGIWTKYIFYFRVRYFLFFIFEIRKVNPEYVPYSGITFLIPESVPGSGITFLIPKTRSFFGSEKLSQNLVWHEKGIFGGWHHFRERHFWRMASLF